MSIIKYKILCHWHWKIMRFKIRFCRWSKICFIHIIILAFASYLEFIALAGCSKLCSFSHTLGQKGKNKVQDPSEDESKVHIKVKVEVSIRVYLEVQNEDQSKSETVENMRGRMKSTWWMRLIKIYELKTLDGYQVHDKVAQPQT